MSVPVNPIIYISDMPRCPDHDEDCESMSLCEVERCMFGCTLRICGKLVTLEPLDGICPEMQRRQGGCSPTSDCGRGVLF